MLISRRAERVLRRLPKDVLIRISAAIDDLADDPYPAGCKKLTGHDLFRIRVGAWRIIYAVQDDRLIVLILTVASRGEAYRRL
ncbi:MAG: type II toxin-antitoxin system RelE/ParE family toxin [Chloroflexota bacterium]|nr:MAG: type II toxin-antitoxin system RelE/ParE family toxin [Chloroflexota bacterium]